MIATRIKTERYKPGADHAPSSPISVWTSSDGKSWVAVPLVRDRVGYVLGRLRPDAIGCDDGRQA
jgi:hypothetical protein